MGTRDFTMALTDLTVTSVEAGYRAGRIAGLREAAGRCAAISANPTWSVEMISVYECALADAEEAIRARIAAIEEEGKS